VSRNLSFPGLPSRFSEMASAPVKRYPDIQARPLSVNTRLTKMISLVVEDVDYPPLGCFETNIFYLLPAQIMVADTRFGY
jgi:hypothetical protein